MSTARPVKWEFWIDGPRGPAISGFLSVGSRHYQLAAHIGEPFGGRWHRMPRHEAMRAIRDELHRCAAS